MRLTHVLKNTHAIHCKCDWTDTGAKQGFSQLIVELCRENIGKIPDQFFLSKMFGEIKIS